MEDLVEIELTICVFRRRQVLKLSQHWFHGTTNIIKSLCVDMLTARVLRQASRLFVVLKRLQVESSQVEDGLLRLLMPQAMAMEH